MGWTLIRALFLLFLLPVWPHINQIPLTLFPTFSNVLALVIRNVDFWLEERLVFTVWIDKDSYVSLIVHLLEGAFTLLGLFIDDYSYSIDGLKNRLHGLLPNSDPLRIQLHYFIQRKLIVPLSQCQMSVIPLYLCIITIIGLICLFLNAVSRSWCFLNLLESNLPPIVVLDCFLDPLISPFLLLNCRVIPLLGVLQASLQLWKLLSKLVRLWQQLASFRLVLVVKLIRSFIRFLFQKLELGVHHFDNSLESLGQLLEAHAGWKHLLGI